MIRFFDILISSLILIFFTPIIIVIAILIFFIDGRPIIYKQIRIGINGNKFKILKFRTMNKIVFKNEELRLSSLGKFLRRTSLDEIPQFINIIRKDMSIVGPRPLPVDIEKKIKKSIRFKRRKVLPGITGLSQINFTGKSRKLDDKIKLDIKLIENYNLKNYFKVIMNTPFILIIRFFKNKTSIIK